MGIFEPVFSVRNYFRIAAFMFVLVLVFLLSCIYIVQSLNSPFFLPYIGGEPGRAKREYLFSPAWGGGTPIWNRRGCLGV